MSRERGPLTVGDLHEEIGAVRLDDQAEQLIVRFILRIWATLEIEGHPQGTPLGNGCG